VIWWCGGRDKVKTPESESRKQTPPKLVKLGIRGHTPCTASRYSLIGFSVGFPRLHKQEADKLYCANMVASSHHTELFLCAPHVVM